jgi:hypothetical protein
MPRFWEKIGKPGRRAAWETLIAAGCLPTDLEWALYWAIDTFDTASHLPSAFQQFHRESLKVLRDIRRLRANLDSLMNVKSLGEPIWWFYSGFFEFSMKEAFRFWQLQPNLARFEKNLKQFGGRNSRTFKLAPLKSMCACHSELILHVYVEVSTKRLFHKETSILLETAADAYSLDDIEFTHDAVVRRYNRCRSKYRNTFDQIRSDILWLYSQRINEDKRLELIPTVIERHRERAKTLVRSIRVS